MPVWYVKLCQHSGTCWSLVAGHRRVLMGIWAGKTFPFNRPSGIWASDIRFRAEPGGAKKFLEVEYVCEWEIKPVIIRPAQPVFQFEFQGYCFFRLSKLLDEVLINQVFLCLVLLSKDASLSKSQYFFSLCFSTRVTPTLWERWT